MANSPHPETVTSSFTLPRVLMAAVERRAKMAMTNKSDIIRRALIDYLPPEEAQQILSSMMNEEPTEYKATKKQTKKEPKK
jgi:metal-responsive CopG/Arc/MetJ family transcriptional regulator